MTESLDALLSRIRTCRYCVDTPDRRPLPHEPRPVLRARATARIAVCGQAPGTRVHASGMPYTDRSGDRLRAWMGVSSLEFYDEARIAIVPMGFCFPGHDSKGGDLPPRPECARLWHREVFAHLPALELIVLAGTYAMRWHLGASGAGPLTETVERWRELLRDPGLPRYVPLPHPSWRNNAWLNRNPWFEAELLPDLRREVRRILGAAVTVA